MLSVMEAKFDLIRLKYIRARKNFFWSDNAGKYQLILLYFEKKDFIWEKSSIYAQDQDGITEYFIHTIIKRTYIMFIQASLPARLLPKVLLTAYYVTNKLFTKALKEKTIYKA